MDSMTITPAALAAIQKKISELLVDIREVRIRPTKGDSTYLVTLDAGYGTHSFIVNDHGSVADAGFGEYVA